MNLRILSFIVLPLVLVLFFSEAVSAKTTDEEIAELKARIAQIEAKVAEIEAQKTELPEAAKAEIEKHVDSHLLHRIEGYELAKGLRIGAGATFVVQGAVNANNVNTYADSRSKEGVTDASYSADLEFEKEFDDIGKAFLHLETGDGAGVEDELEVFSNVNRDADDADNAVKVTEVWYEQYLFDKQFALTFGKVDPTIYADQNEIANDETTQFLGRIFRNAPTIDFPDNSVGIRGLIAPKDIPWAELECQVLDGNSDWEDIADNIFTTYQITLKPQFVKELTGNWRIYGWYKDTDYTKWSDRSKTTEHKYGFGASIDQQITDILTIVGRYSWCDPALYDPDIASSSGANFSLEHTWSGGFQVNGRPWGREKDHIALACGMAIPSDKYKEYGGTDLKADDEIHFEAYYSCFINEHLTISPDIQVIWNPFGADYIVNSERRDETITVIGCRGQLDF